MYANSAYLGNSHFDDADFSNSLTVKSCGNYRLLKRRAFTTYRPKGRGDFQLLYISSGKTHFFFGDSEIELTAGSVVLYRPFEKQKYIYYSGDKPEVFWVHFSGTDALKTLAKYGLADKTIFRPGTSPEFNRLFLQIINELRTPELHSAEFLSLLLQNIFLLVSRFSSKNRNSSGTSLEIENAIAFFNENYTQNISIDDYAKENHMSLSWFIRSFKKHTGITPMQYILSARIANAQSLLESSGYTVSEIASIVGYDNPMYFSRIFKKQTGFSPLEYRKNHSI